MESDHSRLNARLGPMRGLKRMASARTVLAGHAFVRNLRCGHGELTADRPMRQRVRTAFEQLALSI